MKKLLRIKKRLKTESKKKPRVDRWMDRQKKNIPGRRGENGRLNGIEYSNEFVVKQKGRPFQTGLEKPAGWKVEKCLKQGLHLLF